MTPRSPAIDEALSRYRPGWSLEQFFYTSNELFEYERSTWLARQWFLMAHASEVPRVGSYITRELLGEPLIIVRSATGIRAFYNVCRHRGSRICRGDGSAALLTCPYHAWSYGLDGRLRGATALMEGTDRSALGLKPVRLRELGGLLFCALDPGADDIPGAGTMLPGLEFQGLPGARIAARRHYPTAANWKLVMENFHECYHCVPAHPQYSTVMGHIKRYSLEAAGLHEEWNREVGAWASTTAIQEFPQAVFETADAEWSYGQVTRFPIGGGRKSQSNDGEPVAPLMGGYSRFDGGVATFGVPPFVFFYGLNDHAVLFQFLPRSVEQTDVTVTWLVDGAAPAEAVDVERMVWLWDTTTLQDKSIVEENAIGVRSRSYEPGPFSQLEQWGVELISRYIEEMRAL